MLTRQSNVDGQEFHDASRDAMSCAATTTFAIETAQRPFRVDAIELVTDATITQDPANFYALVFRVGGRTVATYSFATGVNGTLTAAIPRSRRSRPSPARTALPPRATSSTSSRRRTAPPPTSHSSAASSMAATSAERQPS
jgi:hypothetical protein